MSDWAGLVWLVVLLAANAFFVGGEFAVISARRSQIEPLAERGSRAARTALYAMEHATLMLATSQLASRSARWVLALSASPRSRTFSSLRSRRRRCPKALSTRCRSSSR